MNWFYVLARGQKLDLSVTVQLLERRERYSEAPYLAGDVKGPPLRVSICDLYVSLVSKVSERLLGVHPLHSADVFRRADSWAGARTLNHRNVGVLEGMDRRA